MYGRRIYRQTIMLPTNHSLGNFNTNETELLLADSTLVNVFGLTRPGRKPITYTPWSKCSVSKGLRKHHNLNGDFAFWAFTPDACLSRPFLELRTSSDFRNLCIHTCFSHVVCESGVLPTHPHTHTHMVITTTWLKLSWYLLSKIFIQVLIFRGHLERKMSDDW